MSVPVVKTNFITGEIAPGLYGHVDLAKYAGGASTMRNMFVSYRGGAYSRAGTAFVGYSKQTGRTYPPRLIPFQFSNQQGLALEFGNHYMRVIFQGAYVTETAINIADITQANPGVVYISEFASAAVPVNSSVSASYVPGNTITLAGGTLAGGGSATVLTVSTTELHTLSLNSPGSGVYAPTNTITLAGGTSSPAAVLTVSHTQVVSATVAAGGTGGTPGAATVTGTTGTGTKFQASVTISAGGAITSVNSITVAGDYTVNPTVPANEPVTGGSLTGAALNLQIGVLSFTITNAGVFTVNPPGGNMTQASTSGSGTGATFQTAIMAPHAVTITTPGAYKTPPSNPVSQASTSGTGVGAQFTMTYSLPATMPANGDWVDFANVGGMVQLNDVTAVVSALSSNHFALLDVFGNPLDTTGFSAFTSGGTVAVIYTLVTPWAEADLKWLKFAQSADVMSICCWNQETGTSYPPYDLERLADDNWSLVLFSTAAVINPPTGVTGNATNTASPATDYNFVITSVNFQGQESVASAIIDINNSVLISSTAGSLNLSWNAAANATYYNVYKALAAYNSTVPPGSIFGFAGQTYGTSFVDSNITADFSQTPPLHQDPFAPGRITGVTITGAGASIVNLGFSITTATGSGFTGYGIVVGDVLTAFVVTNEGTGYLPADTITFTVGSGTPPAGTLVVGPESGTYPSCVGYFQERRVYAATPNQPDTYFMSQPGFYANFDVRNPTIASDAITGTPWSVQVNGIQFMLQMPGGLVCMNGLSTWQVGGAGSSALNPQAITPSSQQAQSQDAYGINSTVPPIRIGPDILYVQSKGSIIRNITYQIFSNNYTGIDITILSSHLFTGFQTVEWAWCQEPYKIIWAIRDDGVLLSLTYLKEENVMGWSRHDTQGLFVTCCNITEPPVDALYVGVKRFPGGVASYMIERMDNRLWSAAEDCWCVDSGLENVQSTPNATLSVSSATGAGQVTGSTNLIGGSGYSSLTTAQVIDDNGEGPGTGCTASLTIVAGVVTAVLINTPGSLYSFPKLVITDPTGSGSGASATLTLSNTASATTDANVFDISMIGWIIRSGGGIMKITGFTAANFVTVNILSPILDVVSNEIGSGSVAVLPQSSGNWTLTQPITKVNGLNHLARATVTGLADGNVISPRVVQNDGSITLDSPATAIIVGLGFTAQLQTPYLMDYGGASQQGQRKRITRATTRVEASRGIMVSANQPDGASQSPQQIAPNWTPLATVPDLPGSTSYNALCPALWTGDSRQSVPGNYGKPGQLALQQSNPLPMQVLAVIPEILPGDMPQAAIPEKYLPQPGKSAWRA